MIFHGKPLFPHNSVAGNPLILIKFLSHIKANQSQFTDHNLISHPDRKQLSSFTLLSDGSKVLQRSV